HGKIDEEALTNIPYIRMSSELLDSLDFEFDARDQDRTIRSHQEEIDRLTAVIDDANRWGPMRPDRYRNPLLDHPADSEEARRIRAQQTEIEHLRAQLQNMEVGDDAGYMQGPRGPGGYTPGPPRHRNNPVDRRFGNVPKSLMYDGRGSWRAFYMKFSKYAEAQRWSAKECKDNLCWCLVDKASEFYANMAEKNQHIEYFDVIRKLERRFGYKDLPETATIAFNNARQTNEESIDDWADSVMTLATKAFRELPDEYMYRQAILRFCHGCADKDAGENVSNSRPTTMEDAVDRVKWAVHTHNAVYGRQRRDVRLR
ncbi:MAG: hypothetical protein ABW168_27520, partial [Sedimenticola sp.]